jgi:hypothetical protein
VAPCGGAGEVKEGKKGFFFGKKKQKTFFDLGHGRFHWHGPDGAEFFCFFFAKKEVLALPSYAAACCTKFG